MSISILLQNYETAIIELREQIKILPENDNVIEELRIQLNEQKVLIMSELENHHSVISLLLKLKSLGLF